MLLHRAAYTVYNIGVPSVCQDSGDCESVPLAYPEEIMWLWSEMFYTYYAKKKKKKKKKKRNAATRLFILMLYFFKN